MKKTQRNNTTNQSRRKFIVGSAAAGGGLALGFNLPFGVEPAAAQSVAAGNTEVNAWVVVKPDDTCVIRIARAEMGQGTHTGLAQLVCEELECDWKKVEIQPITPGQNLARKRVWRDMATGGSRAVTAGRGRPHMYDGAAARGGARRHVYGRSYALVRAAAADIGHRRVDVLIGRLRILCQQRRSGHDLPGLAIAALGHVELQPGLLHRV